MFYWQLGVIAVLFLATICIVSSSGDGDESKICFFTSSGDAKCSAYCINQKKKAGGSCLKKRCVCSFAPAKGDQGNQGNQGNQNGNSQSRQLLPPKIDSTLCELYCKNLEKFDGLYVKDICDCSK